MTAPRPRVRASFAHQLERQQKASPGRRKGERTREKLRVATAQLINEVGYNAMRVADVCTRAGVSPAAFYLYFENKVDVTVDVLTEFLRTYFSVHRIAAEPRSPFEAIYEANLYWIRAARQNAGLLRCLLLLTDEVPEFARLQEAENERWFRRIADSMAHRFPSSTPDAESLVVAAYALGGMMDEVSRRLIQPQSRFRKIVLNAVGSDEELAELLSLLWYRALYATDPPGTRRAQAARALVAASRAVAAPVRRAPRGVPAKRAGSRPH